MAERCGKGDSEREPANKSTQDGDGDDNDRLSAVIVSSSGTSARWLRKDGGDGNEGDDLSENIIGDVNPCDLTEGSTIATTNISSDSANKTDNKFQEFCVHETNFTKGQLILKLKTTKSSSSAAKMGDSVQECGVNKGDDTQHHDAEVSLCDAEESTSKKVSV